jgi:fibronectin type 3 domain-containing protein
MKKLLILACLWSMPCLATTVVLTWTQSTDPTVTANNVYRSNTSYLTGDSHYVLIYSSGTGNPITTYTDTNVMRGATYYYVVTAVDANGSESGFSNEATAAIGQSGFISGAAIP